jgi:hypothetical protein
VGHPEQREEDPVSTTRYTPQTDADTCFICECVCDMGEFGPCRCGCEECGCDDLHVMYPEEDR